MTANSKETPTREGQLLMKKPVTGYSASKRIMWYFSSYLQVRFPHKKILVEGALTFSAKSSRNCIEEYKS